MKQPRILLVEDEVHIAQGLIFNLELEGYLVTHAETGTAAIHAFNSKAHDLVILDLTIPGGMGGRQTMEELLRLDPGVKAIVSSGYSNDLVLANYQAHGFRGMISKPYDVADFTDTVDRVLRGERA